MAEEFELSTISQRSGVELRKLRYCVDHELVPERTWFLAEHEAGRPRRFDSIAAVYLVCAARLLESGVRRDAVKSLMQQVGRLMKPGRNPLNLPLIAEAFFSQAEALIEYADGSHYRCRVGKTDSGWLSFDGRLRPAPDFLPVAVISLNVSLVRKRLLA